MYDLKGHSGQPLKLPGFQINIKINTTVFPKIAILSDCVLRGYWLVVKGAYTVVWGTQSGFLHLRSLGKGSPFTWYPLCGMIAIIFVLCFAYRWNKS